MVSCSRPWGLSPESGRSFEPALSNFERALSNEHQRLGSDTPVKIGPHVLREIVQLAAPNGIPIEAPGEHLGVQSLVESGGEFRLSFFETVERNSHVHVMRAMLENVVDQAVE